MLSIRNPGEGDGTPLQYSGLENPICLTSDLTAETLQARREWQDNLKQLKGKIYNEDYSTQQGSHSKLMEK